MAQASRRRMWWVAAGLAVVLAAAGVGTAWLLGVFPRHDDDVPVAVFLRQQATPDQKAAIEAYLHRLDVVGAVRFETHQEAYDNYRRMFTGMPGVLANVMADDLPESYRAVLDDPDDAPGAKAHLQALAGVEQVVVGLPLTDADAPAVVDPLYRHEVAVFLLAGITAEQKSTVEAYLRSLPTIRLDFVSHADAYAEFRRLFPDADELLALTRPESLPESFRVVVTNLGDVGRAVAQTRAMSGVDAVRSFRGLVRAP